MKTKTEAANRMKLGSNIMKNTGKKNLNNGIKQVENPRARNKPK